MTNNERELVAALEADIQKWEFIAGFFEHSVPEFDVIGGKKMSGGDYDGVCANWLPRIVFWLKK